MFSDWKRRRAARRVTPGDDRPLPRYRWWQPLSRALMHLDIAGPDGAAERWSVDTRLWGDSDGEVRAHLYRDGRHRASSKLPARFPVTGGVIEVQASEFGLRRCHYVDDAGGSRQLDPDPRSAEGRRARLERRRPGLSRLIGAVSVLLLLIGLGLGLPQIAQQISEIPPLAERFGTFTSPVQLSGWTNVGLALITAAASTERALRLRYHWLLDGGLTGSGEE